MKKQIDAVSLADLAGIALFAIEGADRAIRAGLDLFGVLVICFVTSLGGGVIRDVIIGATPPNAIRDWRYPALSFFAGALTFAIHPEIGGLHSWFLLALDGCALSLFAIAGAQEALIYRVGPLGAALMGVVTAVGGGVIRDILMARVPEVLRQDIYASAALLGAVVFVLLRRAGLSNNRAATIGGLTCLVIRLLAVRFGWQLPRFSS